jgi:hypothetical protein
MNEELKLWCTFLGLAVLSAIVRYRTFIGAVLDAVLGFTMGIVSFHLLSYWSLTDEVRCGFTGAIILFARPLYDTIERFITEKLTDTLTSMKGQK